MDVKVQSKVAGSETHGGAFATIEIAGAASALAASASPNNSLAAAKSIHGVGIVGATIAGGITAWNSYDQWQDGQISSRTAIVNIGAVAAKGYVCTVAGGIVGGLTGPGAIIVGPLVTWGCLMVADKTDALIRDAISP